jgi:hypothetical protein
MRKFLLLGIWMWMIAACAATPSQPQEDTLPVQGATDGAVPVVGTALPSTSQNLTMMTVTPVITEVILGERGDAGTIITLEDRDKTLVMLPGQRFSLALSPAYAWDIRVADPAIVSQAAAIKSPETIQGTFEALQPGQTELVASGDPLCRSAQPPCMQPSILFTLQIIVK